MDRTIYYMTIILGTVMTVTHPVWYNPISWFTATPAPSVVTGESNTVTLEQFRELTQRVMNVENNYTPTDTATFSAKCRIYARKLHNWYTVSSEQTVSFAKENSGLLIAGVSVSAAAYWLHTFMRLYKKINKVDNWSFWREEDVQKITSFQMGESITPQLLHEIQVRYLDVQNITDFMGPMSRFLHDIDKEIADLKEFNQLYGILNTIVCGIFVSRCRICDIPDRIKRLLILKGICVQWLLSIKHPVPCVEINE